MDVCFQHGDDAQRSRVRELEVDVDVAARIDDRDLAGAFAADGVGVVRQSLVFEAFKQHGTHYDIRVTRRLLLLAFCLACAVPADAQPLTATLLIEVTDSTGAALPGVALSVVHRASGVERIADTSDRGLAAVPLLQPGNYTVRATLAGFRQTSIAAVPSRSRRQAGLYPGPRAGRHGRSRSPSPPTRRGRERGRARSARSSTARC